MRATLLILPVCFAACTPIPASYEVTAEVDEPTAEPTAEDAEAGAEVDAGDEAAPWVDTHWPFGSCGPVPPCPHPVAR